MSRTDADSLLERFRRDGDPDVFARFYDATHRAVHGRARRLAPDSGSTDDLVQATYLAAIGAVGRFAPGRGALPWLLGILTNQARVMRWRHRRHPDTERLAWPEPDDPASVAADRETAVRIERALEELGPVYGPAMILHLVHGLSAVEIGRALERPAGTVRTQLVRGSAALRKLLPASLASAVLIDVTPAQGSVAVREIVRLKAAQGQTAATTTLTLAGWPAVAVVTLALGALAAGASAWLHAGGAPAGAPAWSATRLAAATTTVAGVTTGATDPDSLPALRAAVPVAELGPAPTQDPEPAPRPALSREALFDALETRAGAGGMWGGRFAGRARLTSRAPGTGMGEAIAHGLEWLARHQAPDGRWDADGFAALDDPKLGPACDGVGRRRDDLAATAFALLAFVQDGKHGRTKEYAETVQNGIVWLLRQQDPKTGAFGQTRGRGLLDHAVASLALTECFGLSNNPRLRDHAQRAVTHLEEQRGPEGYWRLYEAGEDRCAELTAWASLVLYAASAFDLDAELIGRHPEAMPVLPTPTTRALAARGIVRIWLLHRPDEQLDRDVLANLSAARSWPDRDPWLWFLMTRVAYQMGRTHWKKWSTAVMPVFVREQRQDGNFAGSWDPSLHPGRDHGRVTATALGVLTMETYYAYTRVFVR